MTLVDVLAVLLVGYAALCVLLAYAWNVIAFAARQAVAWTARRLGSRRDWRRFMSEHGLEFAAPQYAWPMDAPQVPARRTPGDGVR